MQDPMDVFGRTSPARIKTFLAAAEELKQQAAVNPRNWKQQLVEMVARKCGAPEKGRFIYTSINNFPAEVVDSIREACIGKDAGERIRKTYTNNRAKNPLRQSYVKLGRRYR